MELKTIDDVYESNEKVHAKLCAALGQLSEEQLTATPDGEKWSVAQIVEHVSMVENGILRICSKLLSKAEAEGRANSGALDLSEFLKKADDITDVRLEAPEMVHPTGARSIAESLQVMEENEKGLKGLREKFEKFDCDAHKFPHPYLGDLTALEWLALAGGHKIRHVRQIKRVIEKASAGI